MKKLLLAALFLLMLPLSVSAANGDVVGDIYSTDIRAFINGVEVESYNIGGKTAVVIEDILDDSQFAYDDATRTLEIYSLHPDFLIEHTTEASTIPGKVVGKVYATDITASIYGVEILSYNIGGKTAVAIEDLGVDGKFSTIGGRFTWDETERTIKLDFLYDNSDILPSDKRVTIVPNESLTEAEATFAEVFHCGGYQVFSFVYDKSVPISFPIKAKTGNSEYEVIGYHFRIPNSDAGFNSFTYYYPEQLEKTAAIYTPFEATKESVLAHFENEHYGSLIEQFATDEYTFAYFSFSYTTGGENYLIQVYSDGTYKDYLEEIRSSQKYIKDFEIDSDNEFVTFKYVHRNSPNAVTNYEIDLKTGTIKEV